MLAAQTRRYLARYRKPQVFVKTKQCAAAAETLEKFGVVIIVGKRPCVSWCSGRINLFLFCFYKNKIFNPSLLDELDLLLRHK